MNRVFPQKRSPKWVDCPYRKRVDQLKGMALEEGLELWDSWRTACRLARGPDDRRGEYWAWRAIEREERMKRFLERK